MDSFFGIGIFELVMIAVVALLVLGPERLPGAMREVAKYMRQLRNISNEFQSQFGEELKVLDEINPRRILNEAIDPNSPASNSASPAKTAAKSSAQAATTAAAKPPVAAAAKPLAPKPVTPAVAPATPPAVTNGEHANSILPPTKTETPPASPPATTSSATGTGLPIDALPPPGANPPADVNLDGDQPSAPVDPGAEDQQ
jgi:sec-independent protein translocase protein TatB